MKKLLDIISLELKKAFEDCGYPTENVVASVSNRPDLCEYQCNGAMPLAKTCKKAPLMIAQEVCDRLGESSMFSMAEAVNPGFINLDLDGNVLASHMNEMVSDERFGYEKLEGAVKTIVDYGGPNVAKPLHIGHLRAAIIGESIKRICVYAGHETLGDVHLGDWGLQMGQIIAELRHREPELPYFDKDFTGEYPEEAPFTISALEEIYPAASKKCKAGGEAYDEAFAREAHEATALLQSGERGCMALWRHIMNVSLADLKKNYENLDVHFDLWKGESDVQKYIPDMVEKMKADGYAYESDGALIVDVAQEDDKKELPPCMILKSDGATLYSTTDLATLIERMQLFAPGNIIYVVDKRQGLHFEQVFRAAKKTGIVPADERLFFLGFGTMNGTDGKPYKTRDGGVMRLEDLISEINEAVLARMKENREFDVAEAEETAKTVGLAALKYADLSNQATKDYIFDMDKFTSFEGNTGPYILYTMVRIKSILKKYGKEADAPVVFTGEKSEKELMMKLAAFSHTMESAYKELAPHRICAYIYELADAFNGFYHEVRILSQEDEEKKASCIRLLKLTLDVLEQCIYLLGFSAPERM